MLRSVKPTTMDAKKRLAPLAFIISFYDDILLSRFLDTFG